MKNKAKQIVAVVALAAFVLFTVFGTIGLVITSHHNCEGIHCHTCERIAVIKNVVNIIKTGCAVLCWFLFVRGCFLLLTTKMPLKIFYSTAVSLKTKLNN